MSEVSKIEAIKRSLSIAQRVTSSALVEAKKNQTSLAGGKKRKRASTAKKSTAKKSSKKGKSKKH